MKIYDLPEDILLQLINNYLSLKDSFNFCFCCKLTFQHYNPLNINLKSFLNYNQNLNFNCNNISGNKLKKEYKEINKNIEKFQLLVAHETHKKDNNCDYYNYNYEDMGYVEEFIFKELKCRFNILDELSIGYDDEFEDDKRNLLMEIKDLKEKSNYTLEIERVSWKLTMISKDDSTIDNDVHKYGQIIIPIGMKNGIMSETLTIDHEEKIIKAIIFDDNTISDNALNDYKDIVFNKKIENTWKINNFNVEQFEINFKDYCIVHKNNLVIIQVLEEGNEIIIKNYDRNSKLNWETKLRIRTQMIGKKKFNFLPGLYAKQSLQMTSEVLIVPIEVLDTIDHHNSRFYSCVIDSRSGGYLGMHWLVNALTNKYAKYQEMRRYISEVYLSGGFVVKGSYTSQKELEIHIIELEGFLTGLEQLEGCVTADRRLSPKAGCVPVGTWRRIWRGRGSVEPAYGSHGFRIAVCGWSVLVQTRQYKTDGQMCAVAADLLEVCDLHAGNRASIPVADTAGMMYEYAGRMLFYC